MEKKALGRGLSALIPQREVVFVKNSAEAIIRIPLSQVKTNKYQPRTEFSKEKLNDLVNSIKEKGVIQPVLVRKAIDGYELIAGERRLRAATMLNLVDIPAIIKDVNDADMLEIALIENLQREELNPIEEAKAFERLTTEFNFTQDKIAQTLGKDKSTISNAIRLLGLAQKIQEYLSKGIITVGHAKALLGLPAENERYRVCNIIINKGLSVRETEKLVDRRRTEAGTQKRPVKHDNNLDSIAAEMQQALGTRVKISHGKKRGTIQIEYYSVEDLNRILHIVTAKKT
ncbi:MAG: ParB/RepB/Spo0J family partition protein [Candidatus Omnitrophota bacterium]|jgi:ParB family chromosome partitioning protein|nr:ParB/RepB/Spo0J family partition protein [Candidatus Omnitrophota bacterium]